MPPVTSHVEPQRRIADRLAANRRQQFVGRQSELDDFRGILEAEDPTCVVLYLYGPGGIGKTTLLRELDRLATECSRPVVRISGRDIEPSPAGFRLALRQAMGLDTDPGPSDWPPTGLLLLDNYEVVAFLDAWLRESFLPQLPLGSMVVISGRTPPATAWRTDVEWAGLTRFFPLRNFEPEESHAFLAMRGVHTKHLTAVQSITHGHPLALALVTDMVRRGENLSTVKLRNAPDIVGVLMERLIHDIPDRLHRRALEVTVLAWATTESLLAGALEVEDAHDLFEWLRHLPFMEEGPQGLFPHDLAREVLDADLRWRDPGGHLALVQRLSDQLRAKFQQACGVQQQRIWFDLLHLNRQNPFFAPYFAWSALGEAYAEPANPEEHPAILAMVRKHQGEESERIARHWLNLQPQAFLVYRNAEGETFGFMAQITIHDANAEDIAADPALPAALAFARSHGPVRSGEELMYLRFWMHRDAHQGVSPAINLTAINCSIQWTTHPKLAWNFIAIADPDFLEPHFTSIHMWRSPEADFDAGGKRYGVFAHDWRVEPAATWMANKHRLASETDAIPALIVSAPPTPFLVLSQTEFAEAVRQALRDYTRPDQLATSPLMHARLVLDTVSRDSNVNTLQSLLREAAATLTGNPQDLKFHRALWHTYFEPAPSQERAAELLGLPFNTYRYRLTKGIEHVTEWLWRRELGGNTH